MNMQKNQSFVRRAVAIAAFAICFYVAEAAAQQLAGASESPVEVKVFALANASSPELISVLTPIFKDEKVRLTADKRTNSLIVLARRDVLALVEALLLRLDEAPKGRREDPTGATRLKGRQPAGRQATRGASTCWSFREK